MSASIAAVATSLSQDHGEAKRGPSCSSAGEACHSRYVLTPPFPGTLAGHPPYAAGS
jgi:hypothetical protein